MHYAKRQENKIAQLMAGIASAQMDFGLFKKHLLSEKFWKDSTIQISDVLRRIEEIESDMLKAMEQ